MTGSELILIERCRQISEECWTEDHDDEHDDEVLVQAAISYAASTFPDVRQTNVNEVLPFPWSTDWDKRNKHDRIKKLVIAGALLAAEIDRLNRLR